MATRATLVTGAIARLAPRSRSLSPGKSTSPMRQIMTSTMCKKYAPTPARSASQVHQMSRGRNSVPVRQITECALPIKSTSPVRKIVLEPNCASTIVSSFTASSYDPSLRPYKRNMSLGRICTPLVKSNSPVRQMPMHSNCPPLRSSSLVRPMMTPPVRHMSTKSGCEPPKEKKGKSCPKEKPKKEKKCAKEKPKEQRTDCAPFDVMPRCSPENLEKSKCMDKKKANAGKKPNPFKSMWYNPECCLDPCPEMLPRFDELYWKPSDKAERCYQQTWGECPDIKIIPKKVCCFDNICYPQMEKRKKKDRPKTACPPPDPECPKGDKKCMKMTMPHCRAVRASLKCKIYRGPSGCAKVCAPYPSFSECQRAKPKPKRPVECDCLRLPMTCEVYDMLRKMKSYKK